MGLIYQIRELVVGMGDGDAAADEEKGTFGVLQQVDTAFQLADVYASAGPGFPVWAM